jgi:hypothetical protein
MVASKISIVAVFLLLSGCAAATPEESVASTSNAGTGGPAAPAGEATSDEPGSISGLVATDEQMPIPGADVAIQAGAATKTDGEGKFALTGLEPGDYDVFVEALGYESAAKKISVAAGETTDVTFLLAAITLNVGRQFSYIGNGMIDFAYSNPGVYGNRNDTGTRYQDMYFPMDPDATAAIVGSVWESSAPLTAKWMLGNLWVSTKNCEDVCDKVNETTQGSPIVLAVDDLAERVEGKSGYQINPYMTPRSCPATQCTTEPDKWVQFAYQQKFTTYVTVFYSMPRPLDYSPLPPA